MNSSIRRLAPAALCALAVTACKQTIEGQEGRYTQVKDRLDAYATKNPTVKAGVDAKLAEFEAERKAALALGGEAGIEALGRLASRLEAYEKQINPAATPPASVAGSAAPGAKLGLTTPSAAPLVGGVVPVSGGLPGAAPTAAAGASGFGGSAPVSGALAPAPGTGVPGGSGFGGPAPVSGAPAPAPGTGVPGGSGFGGPAAVSGAAPAVVPAPGTAAGGSGFGGK